MTFQVIILRDDHYFYQENRFYKEFFEISKIGVFTFHVLFNQKFPEDFYKILQGLLCRMFSKSEHKNYLDNQITKFASIIIKTASKSRSNFALEEA